MIDVDHFKSVNDRMGHAGGDRVLQEVAIRIASACRTEDVVGRWGGEEFLVVAPLTDDEGIASLAERARAAAADGPIYVDEERFVDVTVSVGATSGLGGIDLLVREADAALYAAKDAGRNRVIVAESLA
jgi:two-component system cell cycle response regulator